MSGPLAPALGVGRGVVAAIGGGGKTTLLEALARELAAAGLSCIRTTTTRVWEPDGPVVVEGARVVEATRAALRTVGDVFVAAGREVVGGRPKLRGVDPADVDALADLADVVLVEADGAAGRPLKAHAAWEPVVPASTTLVLAVFGVWGVGAPLDGATVHRPELFAARAGLAPGEPITAEAVARVFRHPDGPLRAVPAGAAVHAVLTGAPQDPRASALAGALGGARLGAPVGLPTASSRGPDARGHAIRTLPLCR